MERRRVCSILVQGREVRPRRAAEAFWRWEQALARWTRDIVDLFCPLFSLFLSCLCPLLASGRGWEMGGERRGRRLKRVPSDGVVEQDQEREMVS